MPSTLESARLDYRPLAPADLEAFHALVIDAHVRRYLLDGQAMSREWSAQQITASQSLFATEAVGLWLVFARTAPSAPIGFCGFIRFDETGPRPQLLYALLEPHTGQGYATEIARALVAYVEQHCGHRTIVSAVDAPNAASRRVLEKAGFQETGQTPGAFGHIVHYERKLPPRGGAPTG
jgi:RimJ/RimL family protein N-acetyltransferase